MSPTDVRTTISGIISQKYRSIIVIVAGLLLGLWLALSAYAVNNLYQQAMGNMYSWIFTNKSRLEEGLFLKNTESLRHRIGQIGTLSETIAYYEVTLYDADKNPIFGESAFPKDIPEGVSYPIPILSTSYFDSLFFAGRQTGYLYVRTKLKILTLLTTVLLVSFLCAAIFLIVRRLLSSFTSTLERRIAKPIVALRESMNRFDMEKGTGAVLPPTAGLPATEISELYKGYNALLARIREYSELEVKKVEADTAFRVAAQVAHDIRSPLTALKAACSNLGSIPDDAANLIRMAADRINEIANNLIEENRELVKTTGQATKSPSSTRTDAFPQSEWIGLILEKILSEKRLQFQDSRVVSFFFELTADCFQSFAYVEAGEFRRMLSNVLNNAVEAIAPHTKGEILVQLQCRQNEVVLTVQDNGKGIPANIIPKLAQQGFSHDKPAGTGLGLYHCRTLLEAWGGELHIDSRLGSGTTIQMILRRSDPPEWFLAKLVLRPSQVLVVVDDDPSIHLLWKNILPAADLEKNRITIVNLHSPSQFNDWLAENAAKIVKSRFLVDFEFRGSQTTGLDVIFQNSLSFQSILVTGKSDSAEVRKVCTESNVKLLPKSMAASIPIEFL